MWRHGRNCWTKLDSGTSSCKNSRYRLFHFELFGDADAWGTQLQKGFHQFAAFVQRQSGEIAVVADKKVEDEIVNTGASLRKFWRRLKCGRPDSSRATISPSTTVPSGSSASASTMYGY